jgi:hypothetical protein
LPPLVLAGALLPAVTSTNGAVSHFGLVSGEILLVAVVVAVVVVPQLHAWMHALRRL